MGIGAWSNGDLGPKHLFRVSPRWTHYHLVLEFGEQDLYLHYRLETHLETPQGIK